jgi:hypothetical protein
MPNSIALASKFLPVLDAVYKRESLTSRFDATTSAVQFIGGNAVKLFKIAMDGFGDYSRNNGFIQGSVNGTWETLTMQYDRGISLSVDNMDDEETMGLAFGELVGQFMRTKEIPEVDAVRFATYATNAGNSANADLSGSSDVPDLIATAQQVMGDAEVPKEDRVLFVSETCYKYLKGKITRMLSNERGVNREIEVYDNMEVIPVPTARFQTAVTLYDGSSNFGFVPTAGGYKINFMIVHPTALRQVVKHAMPRIWLPNENINADAYKFDMRLYHGAWVLDNKTAGIYLHRASTAIS